MERTNPVVTAKMACTEAKRGSMGCGIKEESGNPPIRGTSQKNGREGPKWGHLLSGVIQLKSSHGWAIYFLGRNNFRRGLNGDIYFLGWHTSEGAQTGPFIFWGGSTPKAAMGWPFIFRGGPPTRLHPGGQTGRGQQQGRLAKYLGGVR